MVRFLLLSLWILAIGGGSAQKISGQTVYKAHVSDAEGNAWNMRPLGFYREKNR